MHETQTIGSRSPEFRAIFQRILVATRLSANLSNYCMDETVLIKEAFEELIGKPVGEKFTLIPPFHADYGLNITVGNAVFIGHQCAFTGHASIEIGDGVMIAAKTNLVTAGHPVEPEIRGDYIKSAPISIDTNVWVGTAATALPGVHIGRDSVVAAGAVVTRDVPPRTLVAGVPAAIVKEL